jgi:hypothetical protein
MPDEIDIRVVAIGRPVLLKLVEKHGPVRWDVVDFEIAQRPFPETCSGKEAAQPPTSNLKPFKRGGKISVSANSAIKNPPSAQKQTCWS